MTASRCPRGAAFHQEIKDAILKETDRLIYVAGPKAALSDYVRAEWQFALECDHVVVTPILRLGDYDHVPGELSLLHCEDFRDDANYPAALAKLITSLRQPNPKLGALFAVPNLPPNFLGRPELMRRVRDALLVDLHKPQVITGADARVGMQGMGGIGKSVLAAALARNRQVRQAYPDGVVWIAAGQKLTDDDLLKRQRDLARHLGGDDTFASLAQGQGVLRPLLAAKAVLLVLDDVWRAADAQAFDVLGPRCRMLVTTRDKGILETLHGELVPVSLFTEPEALQLLADAVNVAPAALPAEAREVARECGLLPLALALCGGIRYNLSQNDGVNSARVFHFGGGASRTRIYHNTIFIGTNQDLPLVLATEWDRGWADDTRFENNLIYVAGRVSFQLGAARSMVFTNNLLFGPHGTRPDGLTATTNRPPLVQPGSGGAGFESLAGYRLTARPPWLLAAPVAGNGGRDFFGTATSTNAPAGIGAIEFKR